MDVLLCSIDFALCVAYANLLTLIVPVTLKMISCNELSWKSTLACTLSRELHSKGKLSYVLDEDNLQYGLNKDLGFKHEDRTENILKELLTIFFFVGQVAKLFADCGLICIASLISPYRIGRDACRAMLPDSNFIEARLLNINLTYVIFLVFMNMPLELCESRDAKGLYKLVRAGKIKEFWKDIEHALSDNKNGGRIVITIRKLDVALFDNKSQFLLRHHPRKRRAMMGKEAGDGAGEMA
ncbi:hypothetical protein FEM48_Zijuj06G0147800 [Ziziphus jujuba var. spinosa]|uniref:APS kinase domain-containing protein n=1 Tax=Ziziphus jujuba var. spinosa TaxID=714518 RepID=A0A978V9W9_ZIZJJ|nr:hypothetical protein FEM48_Zijuj06G0147800 [Ziziphus jujuba var. spinosa]